MPELLDRVGNQSLIYTYLTIKKNENIFLEMFNKMSFDDEYCDSHDDNGRIIGKMKYTISIKISDVTCL